MLVTINFVLFQIGWFACVYGAANEFPWIGPVIVFFIIMFHLKMAIRPGEEIMLILLSLAIGTFWDSLLIATGWLSYSSGVFYQNIAPYWILALWMLFPVTLNVSLKWLKGRYLVAALFGAVGGPLAYLAGNKLGAVEFYDMYYSALMIGIGWSIIMPMLMLLSQKYNGYLTVRESQL